MRAHSPGSFAFSAKKNSESPLSIGSSTSLRVLSLIFSCTTAAGRRGRGAVWRAGREHRDKTAGWSRGHGGEGERVVEGGGDDGGGMDGEARVALGALRLGGPSALLSK